MNWRQWAQKVIADVEQAYKDRPYDDFRKALRDAYPFYERENHPYKIWCDEQKKALARRIENHVTELTLE